MSRRITTVAGAVLAAALLLGGAASAQAATIGQTTGQLTTTNYVALGDSFATGTGLGSYGTSGSCYRSLYGHPAVLSTTSGTTSIDATFLACNGAKTTDITGQLGEYRGVATNVTTVTLTIGGNDAGFVPALQTCLGSGDCSQDATFTAGIASRTAAVTGAVAGNVAVIRQEFPNARIRVSGYPKLFQTPSTKTSCSVGSLMSLRKTEADYLDNAAVALNAAIKAGLPASDPDVTYVDVATPFTGHGLCLGSTRSWINSLNLFNTLGAFHPNRSGQNLGYATAIAATLP